MTGISDTKFKAEWIVSYKRKVGWGSKQVSWNYY